MTHLVLNMLPPLRCAHLSSAAPPFPTILSHQYPISNTRAAPAEVNWLITVCSGSPKYSRYLYSHVVIRMFGSILLLHPVYFFHEIAAVCKAYILIGKNYVIQLIYSP